MGLGLAQSCTEKWLSRLTLDLNAYKNRSEYTSLGGQLRPEDMAQNIGRGLRLQVLDSVLLVCYAAEFSNPQSVFTDIS
jgi:hypothetical protein